MKGAALSVVGLALQPLMSAGAHNLDPKEWQLYTLIGELRATGFECHRSGGSKVFAPNRDPYLFDCRLAQASKAHAIDMGTRGSVGHGGSDGSNPCQRAKRVGVDTCSENVVMARDHPMSARVAYEGSFSHCQAMMNPDYNVIGVGVYYGKNPYPVYWAQLHHNANKVDSSCHPAPGAIPAPPPYVTRAPPTHSAVLATGPSTLPPGFTLPPGITMYPPDTVWGTGAPSAAPAPTPAPPKYSLTPRPSLGKDREGENASAFGDIKDMAATVHGPPAMIMFGVVFLALRS